ncbi:hypothetical protein LCGC14_2853670 [marine sediment metagenome]|uniref:Uncharacterized protein n=1 Tax=marine sediment metagenome TaxID=412755 RepID=A0A0F8Y7N1_9ZZZZ
MPDQLQLGALRERLDQEVECSCWRVIDRNEGRTGTIRRGADPDCPKCHGTGLNADYDGLREVVRERCTFHSLVENIECICIGGQVSMDGQVHYPCQACKGTGYITRDIEGWPKGALAGALLSAVKDWGYTLLLEWEFQTEQWFARVTRIGGAGIKRDDPDRAALAAVLVALR